MSNKPTMKLDVDEDYQIQAKIGSPNLPSPPPSSGSIDLQNNEHAQHNNTSSHEHRNQNDQNNQHQEESQSINNYASNITMQATSDGDSTPLELLPAGEVEEEEEEEEEDDEDQDNNNEAEVEIETAKGSNETQSSSVNGKFVNKETPPLAESLSAEPSNISAKTPEEPTTSPIDATDTIELRFLVRRREAGALIGKRGSNIKHLRETFRGSMFSIPDTGNGPERVFCVTTDEKSMGPILTDLTQLLLEKSPENDDQIELKLLIHSSHAGSIIGIGGQSIKKLRNDSKAAIKIYEMCCPLSNERVCAIKAKPPVVVSTIKLIHSILNENPAKGTIKLYDALHFDFNLVEKYGGYLPDDAIAAPLPLVDGLMQHSQVAAVAANLPPYNRQVLRHHPIESYVDESSARVNLAGSYRAKHYSIWRSSDYQHHREPCDIIHNQFGRSTNTEPSGCHLSHNNQYSHLNNQHQHHQHHQHHHQHKQRNNNYQRLVTGYPNNIGGHLATHRQNSNKNGPTMPEVCDADHDMLVSKQVLGYQQATSSTIGATQRPNRFHPYAMANQAAASGQYGTCVRPLANQHHHSLSQIEDSQANTAFTNNPRFNPHNYSTTNGQHHAPAIQYHTAHYVSATGPCRSAQFVRVPTANHMFSNFVQNEPCCRHGVRPCISMLLPTTSDLTTSTTDTGGHSHTQFAQLVKNFNPTDNAVAVAATATATANVSNIINNSKSTNNNHSGTIIARSTSQQSNGSANYSGGSNINNNNNNTNNNNNKSN